MREYSVGVNRLQLLAAAFKKVPGKFKDLSSYILINTRIFRRNSKICGF